MIAIGQIIYRSTLTLKHLTIFTFKDRLVIPFGQLIFSLVSLILPTALGMWVRSANYLYRYLKTLQRINFEKVEVAKSSDRDGEDHRPVHLAHSPLHPHRRRLHQPLHLPPHHLAHGRGGLSRCNSWVFVGVLSLIICHCHGKVTEIQVWCGSDLVLGFQTST